MKAFLLCVASVFILGACATTAPDGTAMTPAQSVAAAQAQVAKQCTIVQPFLQSMLAMNSQLSADAMADLTKAQGYITAGCAYATNPATGPASTADVITMVNQGFPMLIKVVDGSNLSKDDKSTAELAITAAQLVLLEKLSAMQ